MSKDEELKVRYYNLIEEQERIEKAARELAISRAKERGIKENQKTVVLNMHKDNIPLDTIAKYVNLTTNEVEKIIKSALNQEN